MRAYIKWLAKMIRRFVAGDLHTYARIALAGQQSECFLLHDNGRTSSVILITRPVQITAPIYSPLLLLGGNGSNRTM